MSKSIACREHRVLVAGMEQNDTIHTRTDESRISSRPCRPEDGATQRARHLLTDVAFPS